MANNTIVIIDDDEDILALIKRILTVTNVPIILYKSGQEFLDNFIRIKSRIGLAFLDLNMPGTNGLVVLKKLQEARKATPFKICVLSGVNDKTVSAKATELGADAFLIKPIDKAAILNIAREMLSLENIPLQEHIFSQVNFVGSLLNSPILLNFNVIGVTADKILLESIFNFREECNIHFSCEKLCKAINYEKEFEAKVIKSVPAKNKFTISAEFVGMTAMQTQTLKSFLAQNPHEDVTFYV